jgi:RHS repeat-associated protein
VKAATKHAAHAGQGVPARFLSANSGGSPSRFGAVHLFSAAALTDQTGAVVERYRYHALGRQTVLAPDGVAQRSASSYGYDIGWTSRLYDRETSQWYFRSRYYSPSLGRFTSRDTWMYVDGMGLYGAYFVPNALDPSGHMSEPCRSYFSTMMVSNEEYNTLIVKVHAIQRAERVDSQSCTPGQTQVQARFEYITSVRLKSATDFITSKCFEQELSEIDRERALRDARIILQATSDVTSFVPGAGQVVARTADGALAAIDVYSGDYASAVGTLASMGPGKASTPSLGVAAKSGSAAERANNVAKGIPESQLGPSGKPKIHIKEHSTRKEAQDAAQDRSRRGGTPEQHSNPTVGDPHYHPDGSNSREHHTYPGNGFPRNKEH